MDDETETIWDHIAGEAMHGELTGTRLDVWPITMSTVEAALANDPKLTLSRSDAKGLLGQIMGLIHRKIIGSRGFFPPGFRKTMGEIDTRLPEFTQGLGVVVDEKARFYVMNEIGDGIQDDWAGRTLSVRRNPIDRVPYAEWEDGSRPFQLFSRWYGFAFTFPGCDIYGHENG
ncbi:MAG: hypothetical protein BMS9Abin28_1339 [Anaerolineae bacterium]|nr:MAG: hypothetical protein BMS9Abin28_1339 [Anaerolineae bacterium]